MIRRVLVTIAVAVLLATAGCTASSTGPADGGTTAQPTVTDSVRTTAAATDAGTATETSTETAARATFPPNESSVSSYTALEIQTGNQTGVMSRELSGDTFVVYYGEHEVRGLVKLADVEVPAFAPQNIAPSEFHYHEATSEAERRAQREALRYVSYEAVHAARTHLVNGPSVDQITIVHTGETTAEGIPLVYIFFDWDGDVTLYNEYVVGFGYGVITNQDSPYIEGLTAAQGWARDNDAGLWASDEPDERADS